MNIFIFDLAQGSGIKPLIRGADCTTLSQDHFLKVHACTNY